MSCNYQAVSTISPTIFRAYDIRGIVSETLTPDVFYTIGIAIGTELSSLNESHIFLGRDGRLSSPELAQALCEGLLKSGIHVIDIGAVPTPLLYFATHTQSVRSGVMVTGSHNPANYNGIKMLLAGNTLKGDAIQSLQQKIINRQWRSEKKLANYSQMEIIPQYLAHLYQTIKLARPLKIVIDCGNGITGKVAPTLFKKLGCDVHELFCEVDGHFPNHSPDTSNPDNLKALIQQVKQQQADIGLAFDGDGDRLAAVSNVGEIIWPDRLLMLFASDILTRNPKAEIIFDVKCSRDLAKVINQYGGKAAMSKTGHSYIKAQLQESNALLAGEMSGHFFFKENWFGFDDGLYAAARLLEILSQQKKTSAELFQRFPKSLSTAELKLAMTEENKFSFVEKFIKLATFPNAQITTIDGLRVDFENGWGLLRASNTSPYLILRFEADTEQELQRIQNLFRKQLLLLDSDLTLPF